MHCSCSSYLRLGRTDPTTGSGSLMVCCRWRGREEESVGMHLVLLLFKLLFHGVISLLTFSRVQGQICNSNHSSPSPLLQYYLHLQLRCSGLASASQGHCRKLRQKLKVSGHINAPTALKLLINKALMQI